MTNIFEQFESFVADENWPFACALAEELTEKLPEVPTTWFNLGVSLDQLNRHFEAAIAFQRFLTLEPNDEGGIFRMLRSLLLARRMDTLFEECRTYAKHAPNLIEELSALEPFENLFRTEPKFAGLLESKPSTGVSASKRRENLRFLSDSGFRIPNPMATPPVTCGNHLRFVPEIALRVLSLKCVYDYLNDNGTQNSTEQINTFVEEYSAEFYLSKDEFAIFSLPRLESCSSFGHISGWFLERMLPLAWILGFSLLQKPDGEPISRSEMESVCEFIGELPAGDHIWDWLEKYPVRPPQQLVVEMEDSYFCASLAVRSARAGKLEFVPKNFDPILNGGVILERWSSLLWALTPDLHLGTEVF